MKKILIILSMLLAYPSFASCPVDDSATVCSLPGFREQVSPVYQQETSIREFADTPEVRLKPLERDDISPSLKTVAPAGSNFNYNSSCQFGICLQNRSTPLFQQPRQ